MAVNSPMLLLQNQYESITRNKSLANETNQLSNGNFFDNNSNDFVLLSNGNDESYDCPPSTGIPEPKTSADCAGQVPEKVQQVVNTGAGKKLSRAVLARKYLVYFDSDSFVGESQQDPGNKSISCSNNNTPLKLGPTKVPLKCVNLGTKELMQCKIFQRDDRGVNILAAHERLGECSDLVNQISELIVTPKHFCFISSPNYGNVHSYIYSKTTLKEAEAKHLFKQMVSIVNFCHSKGVILRDLKMGKFVFTNKERTIIKLESLEDVVILPKADSEDDSLEDRHGCPNYVSPEKTECVLNGIKYSGKSSDVWALGVSLYAMLAGRYPYNDTDCSRLLRKVRSGTYAMIEGISPFAKSLVRCLLTKNAKDRPSCKEALTHPWFRSFDFQPTQPARVRSRDEFENDHKAKRTKFNDDQVVPGSVL